MVRNLLTLEINGAVSREKAIHWSLKECGQERYNTQHGIFLEENTVKFKVNNACLAYYFTLLLCSLYL